MLKAMKSAGNQVVLTSILGNQENHNLEVEDTNKLLAGFGLRFTNLYTDIKKLAVPANTRSDAGMRRASRPLPPRPPPSALAPPGGTKIHLKVDFALPTSETRSTPLPGTLKPGWTPFVAARWRDRYLHDGVWEDGSGSGGKPPKTKGIGGSGVHVAVA